jgi:hypothetical protein
MSRRLDSWRALIVVVRTLAVTTSVLVCSSHILQGSQTEDRRQSRLDAALRREGEALVRLADDAARGRAVPLDFAMEWQNDFFKAQPGTFVPFTLTFDGSGLKRDRALLYVRAERQRATGAGGENASAGSGLAYETIFPVNVESQGHGRAVIRRGFAIPPGEYRVIAALRELPEDPLEGDNREERRTSVLTRDLQVPDFWTGELATSTVILADRLEPLRQPVPADELDENPYVVGSNRIHPALGRAFSRKGELIVVFLVYNPAVGPNGHFDVQVDYHLYSTDRGVVSPEGRRGDHPPARPGERYLSRTNPQRFNPSLMGPRFDPASAPVLAGQGILLSGFEPGEYRLGITVTDLLSRRSLSRDVTFTVIGS